MPPPGRRTQQVTARTKDDVYRRIAKLLVSGLLLAGWFARSLAAAENTPADTVGVIEGDSIFVEGPMSVEVVHGQVKTILRSGSDVHVKAGQARIDLVEGGQIAICGPAHFSVLKAAGAITLALDSGTIHAQIGAEISLNVYTAQIQAHPISIGNGVEDVLVGLDSAGAICIRANKGAVRIEQQLTGQSVIVPQSGDVTLTNGQMETLRNSAGHCACEMPAVMKPMTTVTEVSQLATKEDIRKKQAEAKAPVSQVSAQQTEQPDEPIYQIFMPPLHYDAKTKVQEDFDPNLIIMVRRVRVRPTLIFQGRVEGNPVVTQNAEPPQAPKTQPVPQKPPEESTWSRVRTYLRKLWSPTT